MKIESKTNRRILKKKVPIPSEIKGRRKKVSKGKEKQKRIGKKVKKWRKNKTKI